MWVTQRVTVTGKYVEGRRFRVKPGMTIPPPVIPAKAGISANARAPDTGLLRFARNDGGALRREDAAVGGGDSGSAPGMTIFLPPFQRKLESQQTQERRTLDCFASLAMTEGRCGGGRRFRVGARNDDPPSRHSSESWNLSKRKSAGHWIASLRPE